ncbi:MAG TPA: hypothetical protein VFX98_15660, partial [Longimicrobiaceae bacterium]|nr:hypothetical protein [Longimicrobiaceae bacterium]
AALTALALAAMALVLRPGVEVEPEVARRVAYIRGHLAAWRLGWMVWMAAAIALTGFYAWWGARARNGRLALLAVLAAGVGLAFDLVGESLYAAWLPELANEDFEVMQRLGTLLTSAGANTLYTAAGVALTLATPGLGRAERAVAWTAWAAGAALTVAGVLDHATGMAAASGVLFPAVVLLCLLVGRRLR